VRMQDHAGDSGVYIRSMASRGHLGGLAWATPQALRVLDAAGCDVVLIETVGVGQSELEIASLADTTLVLVAPGMGDGIQAAKAGILEVADVFVVNKADRDGAETTVRDLRYMLSLGGRHSEAGHWRPPIVKTVASRDTDSGIDEVLDKVEAHRQWLESSGEGHRRRSERAAREIEAIALASLRERMGDVHGSAALGSLADQVVAGQADPYGAADELLAQL
jgi:LAO/AO transport system ATPase